MPAETEERVANVECVRCGTRTEMANEASDGLRASAAICAACGASLADVDTSERAALNEIFSAFERAVQPAVEERLPGASDLDEPPPTVPWPATFQPELDSDPAALVASTAVTTPQTPSAIAAAQAASESGDGSAFPPAESALASEVPSVASLESASVDVGALAEQQEAEPAAPPSEHFGELASSSERAVEASVFVPPSPEISRFEPDALRASMVDSGWSTPTAAPEPLLAPEPSFAVDASERMEQVSAASVDAASAANSQAEGASRVSKGPPPPPAWAFADDESEVASAQQDLREAAPESPVRAEHPSFAEDDELDSQPQLALPLVVAASTAPKPFERTAAPAPLPPAAPLASRLASEAPVVNSLLASAGAARTPLWGAPGSKRRSQTLAGLAGLAVIASFFLGRSSVTASVRTERAFAAKGETPRSPTEAPVTPLPPAPPSPKLEPERAPQAARESAAPSASAPAAASRSPASLAANPDPGSPLVIVPPAKGHAAVLAATSGGTPLDLAAADDAIVDAAARASSCRRPEQAQKRATVTVTFAPSGRVASANISGIKFGGVTLRNCMGATFLGARVPAFNGPSVTVRKTLKM